MAGIEDVQRAINAEMARKGYNRSQMADLMQLDSGTLGDLLDGKRKPKAPTQGKVERYFGWPAGSIAEVLAGRPVPALSAAELVRPGDIQGKIGDPQTEEEAVALLRVLERQHEESLAAWAEAKAKVADLGREIKGMEERRAEIIEDIVRIQSLFPEARVLDSDEANGTDDRVTLPSLRPLGDREPAAEPPH